MNPIQGIHHVTAISGPAQQSVDFHAGVLGLRLVKRTVNFDDPGTYHLYFGNREGSPGSILTFFPWAGAPRGRSGRGQTAETSFAIPDHAISAWQTRFREKGVDYDEPTTRFGQPVVPFRDPDGLVLALVAVPSSDTDDIIGFHGVALDSVAPDETARVLVDVFGYRQVGSENGRTRFHAANNSHTKTDEGSLGAVVDIVGSDVRATQGVGTVHHVAFRARNDEEQLEWQDRIRAAGLHVTDVKDRNYFRSIYFREPGGILFEIATDPPGFTADEPLASLGMDLKLPEWLEPHRTHIEAQLPPLTLPAS
ncbi:MAG: ring-cleaving dioxygenase [Rhodothermales bacterium]